MSGPNGVILYKGASLIDGAPIVAIATGLANKSSNRKTGAMLQTYILRARIDPIAAVRKGADYAICGDCRHRGASANGKGRTCYVNLGQGPLGVYRAYKRGRYPMLRDYGARISGDDNANTFETLQDIGAGRIVRLGTYGDPAAVPGEVWRALVSQASGHTGYTHRWRDIALGAGLRDLCMASVDTVAEAREAQAQGWRTFRVDTTMVIGAQRGEALCPASEQAGKKLTCSQCLACGGADGRRGSVYIPAHGGFAVMATIARLNSIPITVEGRK